MSIRLTARMKIGNSKQYIVLLANNSSVGEIMSWRRTVLRCICYVLTKFTLQRERVKAECKSTKVRFLSTELRTNIESKYPAVSIVRSLNAFATNIFNVEYKV